MFNIFKRIAKSVGEFNLKYTYDKGSDRTLLNDGSLFTLLWATCEWKVHKFLHTLKKSTLLKENYTGSFTWRVTALNATKKHYRWQVNSKKTIIFFWGACLKWLVRSSNVNKLTGKNIRLKLLLITGNKTVIMKLVYIYRPAKRTSISKSVVVSC